MGFHTFDPAKAARLDDESRYQFCSRDELLGALAAGGGADDHLLDLGSGTGFYTTALAPFFDRVSAVDIQPEMHDHFRDNGVPANVSLVESSTDSLPLADSSVDAVVSTMTAHELPLAATLTELRRVLDADGRLVIVDWSAEGRGEAGPPRSERLGAADLRESLTEAGFSVERAEERGETLLIAATSN
ncbi:class I SAM-dependent methyltransferase [Halonotius roseus]|uniref:Class I SAM-dependent methyltransferase n=1 Tax=Halonotius roseus TaxID=2511997 RepID=A0A544QLE9_9EURY|nr:class I SAM-dependent methyltransferase [Halonotius roseus]TQQ79402.1 class I SAM-dependent methyltransferase [Halonotius roseus]